MSLAKDLRQRKDCECTRSTDIGQYTLQCPHGCDLFALDKTAMCVVEVLIRAVLQDSVDCLLLVLVGLFGLGS